MKCHQAVEYGRPLELIERETPRPRGSEVLLRVTASGGCHIDVHLRGGYLDLARFRYFASRLAGLEERVSSLESGGEKSAPST